MEVAALPASVAEAVSVVLPIMTIEITPLCVPVVMAAKAALSVGYDALAVPIVDDTLTFCADTEHDNAAPSSIASNLFIQTNFVWLDTNEKTQQSGRFCWGS